jgi:hypothetical protein
MGQIIAGLIIACILYPFARAAEILSDAVSWIRKALGAI